MNAWNTLPESYQHWEYHNTLRTVQRLIQQVENTTPAMLISVEAAHGDNSILLDNLGSEVALEESEIGSTHPNIPLDNDCKDDELHFGMLGGYGDYQDEGVASNDRVGIHTASWQRRPATELDRFDQ
jgi:hypothetical protein